MKKLILLSILLIVGCDNSTEPDDNINFEDGIVGCWMWDDNIMCFLENNILYHIEQGSNSYSCYEQQNYTITDDELTMAVYEGDEWFTIVLTYAFSDDFNQILIFSATYENGEEMEGFQAMQWTKWNNIEYTQFCP